MVDSDERLALLRPIDDELMRCLFRGNLPLAQYVLRIVTGIEGLRLVREETQLDLKRLAGAHSAELDVWGVDEEGAWYDFEVQRGYYPDLRRARYYSAAMDIEALDAGQEFSELPEQWVIFMMEHDPFGRGRPTYLFRRVCEGMDGGDGDGTHILYVNGAYRGDDALGRLMHDFAQYDSDEMHDGLLRESVQYYKREPEGVALVSAIVEEMCNEAEARGRAAGRLEGMAAGRLEGMAEGRLEGLSDGVKKLMESMGITAQEALNYLGVTGEERAHLLAML